MFSKNVFTHHASQYIEEIRFVVTNKSSKTQMHVNWYSLMVIKS